MGEVAAAVVAGALTPAEGLRVTATRSRLMAPLSGQGGMAMLGLDAAATEALIADYPQVTLGIYNSPRQTVIAGPTEQIDELVALVRAQNRFAGRVNIEVAPHNPAMDALQPAMRSELADLAPRTPTIPIISTTYQDLSIRPVFDAEHWATNMRNPVRFQHAISAPCGTDTHHTFIEISAHPLLTQAITETLGSASHAQHRDAATPRRRHREFPHQPQRGARHPTADSASARATPADAHHPVAPHPALARRLQGDALVTATATALSARAIGDTASTRRLALPAGVAGTAAQQRRRCRYRRRGRVAGAGRSRTVGRTRGLHRVAR